MGCSAPYGHSWTQVLSLLLLCRFFPHPHGCSSWEGGGMEERTLKALRPDSEEMLATPFAFQLGALSHMTMLNCAGNWDMESCPAKLDYMEEVRGWWGMTINVHHACSSSTRLLHKSPQPLAVKKGKQPCPHGKLFCVCF